MTLPIEESDQNIPEHSLTEFSNCNVCIITHLDYNKNDPRPQTTTSEKRT